MKRKYTLAFTGGFYVGSGIGIPASLFSAFWVYVWAESLIMAWAVAGITLGAVIMTTVVAAVALAYTYDLTDLFKLL